MEQRWKKYSVNGDMHNNLIFLTNICSARNQGQLQQKQENDLHIILGMQIYIPNTSHISMNQNPV
jgi:hypothetical protein